MTFWFAASVIVYIAELKVLYQLNAHYLTLNKLAY